MKVSVRYYTRSGNTEKLANAIAVALGVEAATIDSPLLEKIDILFLGCSYYAFDVDDSVKNFILANKENIGKVVCFGTSAMMKSIYKPVKRVTDQAGILLAADEFHCRGSFGPMHKGRPDEHDLESAAAFAKKVVSSSV